MSEAGQWFYQLDHVTFSIKCSLVCKLCTVILPDLFSPNAIFVAGVKVDISSKKLHTKNYF